jgi:ribose transport system substrate-binding protein
VQVRFQAATVATVAAAALAGCGGSSGEPATGGGGGAKARRIAIVFPTLAAPYTQFIAAGARAADKRLASVQVDISTSNELTDTQQQIQKIEDALTKQPAGLAVFPSVAEPLVPSLERAQRQGAKVLVIDQDIPSLSGKLAFVGTDNEKGGEQAGRYMVEHVSGGEIGIIGSSPGITSTDARVKGFKTAIAGSKLKLVTTLVADCDRSKAQSVMEDILSAHPRLAGVFSVCDESAIGAGKAIVQAGKAKQIELVGFDGSPEAVDLIAKGDGSIDADIAQNPYAMGERSVEALARALDGKPVDAVIDTGTDVVTPENAAKFQSRKALIGK